MNKFWRRLFFLIRKHELDRDLEDEMRFHLEMKAQENHDAGMPADEARFAAQRRFGNATLAREASREFWGWPWLDRLGQDLRYALRTLRGNPGFTTVAVLTLALGIGANTAVFTLVNAVMLRMLPVRNPQELVLIRIRQARDGSPRRVFSCPLYKDLRDRNEELSGLLGHYPAGICLSGIGGAENLIGELVTGNYFHVLGIEPALGRAIGPDDDRVPGGNPVCVLSNALWRRRFAADPAVIGRTVTLNSRKLTVIGVTSASFTGTEPGRAPALYVPMMMQKKLDPMGWDLLGERGSSWLQIIGRLKPGMDVGQARAGLQVTIDRIAREAGRDAGRVTLSSGAQGFASLRSMLKKPLLVLMASTALVLLIACANLATLLLARAASRRREMAVRLALGAGRGRLIRQLLTESIVLAAGGAAGLLLAGPLVNLLVTFLPPFYTDLDVDLDRRVFGFLAGTIAGVAVLFGLAPALESTRLALAAGLKDLAEGVRRRLSLRQALVAGQIALCIVLLVGAGLFISSLRNLRLLNPGFEPENLVLITVFPRLSGYSEAETQAFYGRALGRVRSSPGVRAASLASIVPLSGSMASEDFTPEGAQFRHGEDRSVYRNTVAPGYFETIRMPVLLGRDFTARDRQDAQRVAIVNDKLAKRFWPGQYPVGKRISWGDPFDPKHALEIVAVVGNHKYGDLREDDRLTGYRPVAQDRPEELTIHVRAAGEPRALIPALRAEIRELDRNLPIYNVKTMAAEMDESLSTDRLLATLSGAFAGLALLLAAICLYGVMAYMVARRTHEIGVRIAFGAARADVLRLVLGESALLIATGVAIGLPASWAASKLIATFLYGLTPREPAVYAAVTILLVGVALVAAYLPARRATRIEPAITLRCD